MTPSGLQHWPPDTRVPVVTRFAPSPTGYLHLGHVVNAIYVWGMAHATGGTVIVRLEDHDRIRSRPEFASAIIDDLRWLGFVSNVDAVVRQQDRNALYADALERLLRVAHVYACDCSRTSFEGQRYPGRCRDRGLAETAGRSLRVQLEPGVEQASDLRLGLLQQTPTDQCGDLIVRDRDGHWTYQFAVTVDDLDQGVTVVVRGEDLLSSTGRQVQLGRWLQRAGIGTGSWPPQYLHHALIFEENGAKLSKSTRATGVRHLRAEGVAAGEVIGRAAAAVHLIDAPRAIDASNVSELLVPPALARPVEPSPRP